MIRYTNFISKRAFEQHTGKNNEIFISISGSPKYGDGEGQAKKSGAWRDGMYQVFDDIDKVYKDFVVFSDEQANDIVNFLEKYHKSAEKVDLIVHCFAGISRSAAIALFADEVYTSEKNRRLNNYSVYNKLVYSKLRMNYQTNVLKVQPYEG